MNKVIKLFHVHAESTTAL